MGDRRRDGELARCCALVACSRSRDQDVLGLARLLRDAGFYDTAEWLKDAYDLETKGSLSPSGACADRGRLPRLRET